MFAREASHFLHGLNRTHFIVGDQRRQHGGGRVGEKLFEGVQIHDPFGIELCIGNLGALLLRQPRQGIQRGVVFTPGGHDARGRLAPTASLGCPHRTLERLVDSFGPPGGKNDLNGFASENMRYPRARVFHGSPSTLSGLVNSRRISDGSQGFEIRRFDRLGHRRRCLMVQIDSHSVLVHQRRERGPGSLDFITSVTCNHEIGQ